MGLDDYYDCALPRGGQVAVYVDLNRVISINAGQLSDVICQVQRMLSAITDAIVALMVRDKWKIPAVMIGVNKSGNAFMCIDSDWDDRFVMEALETVKCQAIITDCVKSRKDLFASPRLQQNVAADTDDGLVLIVADLGKRSRLLKDIVYVAVTSGTTGQPKYVAATHSSICPNIDSLCRTWQLSSSDVMLQSTPFTFDPSIVEIFCCFKSRATLLMIADDVKTKFDVFADKIDSHGATILQITPGVFNLLCDHGCQFKFTRCLTLGGGEFTINSHVLRLMDRMTFYNIYGLTEMSCWASIHRITTSDLILGSASIGRCMDETSFEFKCDCRERGLLHDSCRLYLGSRTRRCFKITKKTNALLGANRKDNTVLLDTGDEVVSDKKGLMYWTGRSDEVVKKYGHKLCLSDLRRICNLHGYADIIPILVDAEKLVFVMRSGDIKEDDAPLLVSRLLAAGLLLPDEIVCVDSFKLTRHGKIDKRYLTHLYKRGQVTSVDIRFRNSGHVHALIRYAWKSILGVDPQREANTFRQLGGSSIKALMLGQYLESFMKINFEEQMISMLIDGCTYQVFVDVVTARLDQQEPINEPDHSEPVKGMVGLRHDWKFDTGACVDSGVILVEYTTTSSATRCGSLMCVAVIVASHSGSLYSLTMEDGHLNWRTEMDSRLEASPAYCKTVGLIAIGDYVAQVNLVRVEDGVRVHVIKLADIVKATCLFDLDDGVVMLYFGCYDQSLYAFSCIQDETTMVYARSLDHGPIASTPCVVGSFICVATLRGYIDCVDKRTGAIRWSVAGRYAVFADVSSLPDTQALVCCDVSGSVICYRLQDGTKLWKFRASASIFCSPTIITASAVMLVGSNDRYLRCVDFLLGRQLWKLQMPARIVARPILCGTGNDDLSQLGNIIAVASIDGTVKLVTSDQGKTIAKTKIPGQIFSDLACYDCTRVYFGCRDDNIYAMRILPHDGTTVARFQ